MFSCWGHVISERREAQAPGEGRWGLRTQSWTDRPSGLSPTEHLLLGTVPFLGARVWAECLISTGSDQTFTAPVRQVWLTSYDFQKFRRVLRPNCRGRIRSQV